MFTRILAPLCAGLVLFFSGCSTPAAGPQALTSPLAAAISEPYNLSLLKEELNAYADSGRYEAGLAAVAAEAVAFVQQRAPRAGEKLAIVFDLDETLLSNLPHIREQDYGYIPRVWAGWVEEAAAPVIPSVAEVYRAARARDVTVFYITGRLASGEAATEKNLRAVGLADYAALYCKPDDYPGTSQAFKIATRKLITEQGYTIIANIGDQHSDLEGGYAERTFKLPNPFYITK